MKRRSPGSNPAKAYSDGFAAGLRKGRDERDAEVRQLKAALDKALVENLANRSRLAPLDAVALQEPRAATQS